MMSSRSWLNLALLLAAVGLALVAVFEPGKTPPPPTVWLTALDPAQIGHIRIERPDAPLIELRKQDGEWRMEAPFALPADDFHVDQLTAIAHAVSRTQLEPAADALDRYGLEEPAATLYLDDVKIAFGDTEPVSGRRYALVGGTVHLVANSYFYRLNGDATGLLDPSPLGPDAEPVEITLPGLHLQRGEDHWTLRPEQPQASADDITALVQAWKNAHALSVARIEKSTVPAEAPELSVRLAGGGEPLRFRLLHRPDALVLARPELGIAYRFSPEQGQRLLALPAPQGEDSAAQPAPAGGAGHGAEPDAGS